ncbi:MAG: alpha/beta hydrolase [Tateyamaria sp.]|uniref:alpha/beta hydrolase n=1 Tax=Tateyamaria sp. TaxID=1929288 RepID=UPI00329F2D71
MTSIRLSALLVILAIAACARAPELVGIDNPEVPTRSIVEATKHKVFIVTTREDTEVVGALFSELRADELGLASVEVSVPPTHVLGELERPKSLPPDPRTEFAVIDPAIYGSESAFLSSLNSELRSRPASQRELLLFVHGYNMTTSDAILQVGQFVEDSGFTGVPVLFAWASAGQLSRYVYDLNSALVARPLLIDASEILAQSIATEYHVFAHSMGGFLTMEAIVDVTQKGQFNRTGRLQNVVLASPDIDLDLFRSQMGEIDTSFDRFFVLLSKDDSALRASRRIAGGVPRVGAADADELSTLGVTVIDLSQVDDSKTGSHSKFSGSPNVVQLIGRGLNDAPGYGSRRQTALEQVIGDLPVRVVPASN